MHTLPADADLTERKIKSKASGAVKYISMLLAIAAFTILLTFDHFPRAKNYEYSYHFIRNKGVVETVSMFTRLITTPLLFMCKFIVKSLVYKGRTVIIKIPLVRHVMPKLKVRGFLAEEARGQPAGSSRYEEKEHPTFLARRAGGVG
mmetsp:Transcript_104287/g.300614  ORF Transcript_104287/g.300614 Transcript_104287/m.300614 type:complete len:147 (-) Transcript_104287:74-514(-)